MFGKCFGARGFLDALSAAAQFNAVDAEGNSPGTYKYAFGLHYNDGTNTIQVIAGYGDMPLKTKEDMVAAIPRSDLEKAARAFMDAYTHAW